MMSQKKAKMMMKLEVMVMNAWSHERVENRRNRIDGEERQQCFCNDDQHIVADC